MFTELLPYHTAGGAINSINFGLLTTSEVHHLALNIIDIYSSIQLQYFLYNYLLLF